MRGVTTEREYMHAGLSACRRQIAQVKGVLASARCLETTMTLQLQEAHNVLVRSNRLIERSCKLLNAQDGMAAWVARKQNERRKMRSCLAALEDALARCRYEDVGTVKTYAALHLLGTRAKEKWPFERFRSAMEEQGPGRWQFERRWRVMNDSLTAIKRAVAEHNGW